MVSDSPRRRSPNDLPAGPSTVSGSVLAWAFLVFQKEIVGQHRFGWTSQKWATVIDWFRRIWQTRLLRREFKGVVKAVLVADAAVRERARPREVMRWS